MARTDTLDQLCLLLQGAPVAYPDWSAVLALANQALVTPRLEDQLVAANAPADVGQFVRDVARRNRERNARLFIQLADAVTALNAADIWPLVLKGGALLARSGGVSTRIITDLDLVVAPHQVDAALDALSRWGFSVLNRYWGADLHAVAELGRPQDVGQIDLHQRPPGPPGFVSGPMFLDGDPWPVVAGQVRAPSLHTHIYLQALHDQLHDGGYWRGGFDLRHAWDLADLIQTGEVDWKALDQMPPTRLTAHAVEAQLMACRQLTGAPIPAAMLSRRAQGQYRRQRLQFDAPPLTLPVAALTVMAEAANLPAHRLEDRLSRLRAGLPAKSRGLPRLGQILRPQTGSDF